MQPRVGEPLPHQLSVCTNCGESSWLVAQPNGTNVALADRPGPYVIRDGIAYLTRTNDGYGEHSNVCTHRLSATLIADPTADDFAWI
jgi:hypothetical protein